MAKKKPTPTKPRPGRPRQFSQRTTWFVLLDAELAAAAEAWREERGMSQSGLVEEAMRRLIKAR